MHEAERIHPRCRDESIRENAEHDLGSLVRVYSPEDTTI
jgi:hypothetical protein